MTFAECKQLIKSDLRRIAYEKNSWWLRYLITNASFKITFWFRIGSYLKNNSNNYLYRFLYYLVSAIHKRNQFKTGIQLPIGTKIGKGLTFAHFSDIVINKASTIGENCTIYNGVTIGSKRGKVGEPIIGNNVVITTGAKIIGSIRIGNNAVVGANAVVLKDVPDNAVMGGIPAKILNMNGLEISRYYAHGND